MRRFAHPPASIAEARGQAQGEAQRDAQRAGDRGTFQLVRGEILAAPPIGAHRLADGLPYGLGEAIGAPEAVATRVDIEDDYRAFSMPALERLERCRDFYVGDDTGRALLRIAAAPADGADGTHGSRLHGEVELHLDGTFREHRIPATQSHPPRNAYLRALRVGDPVYVFGRMRVERDRSGFGQGGYREAPLIAVFSGDGGPLHLYDEPAFEQVAAWSALPWYRKLSVMVRNR
jgi:hypothetical protein